MDYVTKITNGMFVVSSEMADVNYIVWLDNADDTDRAMEIADRYFADWLTTDDYNKQEQGYIGIVQDAFYEAYIEAVFYDRVEKLED